jgi:hypothetical protein
MRKATTIITLIAVMVSMGICTSFWPKIYQAKIVRPTTLTTSVVSVSSYTYTSLLTSEDKSGAFVQNPSATYNLYLTTSTAVPKTNGIIVFPKSTMIINGNYPVYGIMEDEASSTSIRVFIEK